MADASEQENAMKSMDVLFDCPKCSDRTVAHIEQSGASTSASFRCPSCSASASVRAGIGDPFDTSSAEAQRAIGKAIALLGHFAGRSADL